MMTGILAKDGQAPLLPEGATRALQWLRSCDAAGLAPGTCEIEGRGLYAVVACYRTRPSQECRLETHRRYIDVQYVAAGRELMGHAPAGALVPDGPYDPERDVQFHAGRADFVLLKTGMYAIMPPGVAHMPGVAAGGRREGVKKIVVKAAVAL